MYANHLRPMVVALASILVLVATPLLSQTIHGKLLEQLSDKAVGGASVTLVTDQNAQVASAQTSNDGTFMFRAPTAGTYRLRVSKNGYRASETPAIQLQSGDDVSATVHILPNKIELSPLVVTANNRRPSGKLNGFYDRMQKYRNATFITRDQIDKRRPFNVSDLLTTVPGIIVRPRIRGFGNDVRTVGGCRPTVLLDGLPYPLMGESIDDIVSPRQLEGIEVYSTWAEVPPDLNRGFARCGVIALWTK
jgi:hypothetical protein